MSLRFRSCSWAGLVVLALLCHCDAQMACRQTSCRNGGTCVIVQESLTCICPSNFTGTTCEDSLPAAAGKLLEFFIMGIWSQKKSIFV